MAKSTKQTKKPNRTEAARQRREAKQRAARMRWIGIGLIPIVIIGLIIATAFSRQANTPDPANLDVVNPANVQGSISAPVVIVEWGDFG